jgi:hypothetical protein
MRNRILLSLYLISIFLAGLYAFKKPYYNWDMVAYMAVVIGYDHPNPNYVHDTVYAIVKQQIPGSIYSQLIDGGIEFRKRMAENPNEFYRQMTFYAVKPLYTRFIYFIYKTGVPLIQATILPSLIGYLLIGFLLIFWIKRYLEFSFAIAFCFLTMISAPMWDIARCSSPDCLSAFLLLSAIYFILEIKSLPFTFIFLVFSILSRLDNVIPAVIFISLLTFSNKWKYKISINKYFMMLLIISITCLCITLSTRHFGWNVLYYPTFLKSLNLSYTFQPKFYVRGYIALAISQIMTGLFFSHFLLFMVLALLSFKGKSTSPFRNFDFEQLFLCTLIAIMIIRFILQPVMSDRFYIAYYLAILILLVKRLCGPVNIS